MNASSRPTLNQTGNRNGNLKPYSSLIRSEAKGKGTFYLKSAAADDILQNIAADAGYALLLATRLREGDPTLNAIY